MIFIACSGDDKDKDKAQGPDANKPTPDFVRNTSGPPSMGALPPPVIIGSGPGSGGMSLSVAPVPGSPGVAGASTAASSGLTVRHVETATVAADQAFVLAQLQPRASGPGPFSPGLSGREQEQITAALTAIGVEKEDINFETNTSYGPFPAVSVPVPLNDLQTRGRQIIDAMETAIGSRPQSGARFALSDCRVALEPLRRKALEAAATEAKALAAASSLTLGPLRAVSQTLGSVSIGGPPSADPCSGQAGGPKPPGALLALDAEPKVNLSLQIEVTYGVGDGDAAGGLTVTGSGKATAKADEVYVVVTVYNQSPGPFAPSSITKKTRDELVAKLKALKIEEDDIEIENAFGGPGQTIVSVEVPLADLQKTGKDVIAAVEDVLGRSQSQGALFTHSNCPAVLAEARKQAIADAKRAAEALASSATVKLGNLTALSESAGQPVGGPYGPGAARNPCSEDVATLFQGGPYNVSLRPLDSAPEFTINTNVSVTYAITP